MKCSCKASSNSEVHSPRSLIPCSTTSMCKNHDEARLRLLQPEHPVRVGLLVSQLVCLQSRPKKFRHPVPGWIQELQIGRLGMEANCCRQWPHQEFKSVNAAIPYSAASWAILCPSLSWHRTAF